MPTNGNSQLADATFLIVDDNPENLRVLRDMLSELGCTVRVARDGSQALQSVETSPPDIILLDIHMPGLDGYEVCRKLKADKQYCDIPVIFLSALGETFNKVVAFECGGADYITKPFQFEEVRLRVQAHLKTHHLLAESQAGFRSSFEQAAVGMAHLSTDGVLLHVNQKFCVMLGYSGEELLGREVIDLTASGYRETSESHRRRIVDGALESISGEIQFIQKTGERLWCRTTLSLVRVEATHDEYLSLIIEDISDRKRAEDELRQLAVAIKQTAEAIVVTDTDGAICYVNPAWERMTGAASSNSIGDRLWDILQEHEDVLTAANLTSCLKEGRVWSGRLRFTLSDGSPSTEEVTVAPVRSPEGEVVNYVAVARNITAQIALEERLRHAQKLEAIGTLAGGIVHDFNNILSVIMGYTGIAISDVPEDSDIHANLTQVLTASNRAKELVNQILAFSRQSKQEVLPVEIQTVARETMKLLRGSIPPTISIREYIDDHCDPVFADPTGIHQVLMNLCTNAYHAMQESGGVLSVRLSQVMIGEGDMERDMDLAPGNYARLEVRDTGHGMDEETRLRVFEPYFTTKDYGEGTGLGLATVHGIVTDIGGVIHVYSEPGTGSNFTVLLPCMHDAELPPSSRPHAEGIEGSERILLVDDEDSIGNFAKIALDRMGYTVTTESSPTRALELFASEPDAFDVVVTDQMMPVMRGTELSRKIHAIRADIPVILCSGFAQTIQNTSGEKEQIQHYLTKPVIGTDLARAIRSVVDAR